MISNKNLINNLILIGGGIMRKGETEKIDRWILKMVKDKKRIKRPKVLFVPSASGDLDEYVQDFTKRYIDYGAIVDSLFLIKESPSKTKIKKHFLNADLIYFGGGSVELLLETFKKFNLEPNCIKAVKNGAIICGLSAGAIIWGRKFLTFDREKIKFVNYRIENGLDWTNSLIIPHFDPLMLKNKRVLNLLRLNSDLKILIIGNETAAYWRGEPTPLFKKQKRSSLGAYLLLKDLIRKYE